jgi:putative transposase
VLIAALGIIGDGHKHPLGLFQGATDNRPCAGPRRQSDRARLDTKMCQLFTIDGGKALMMGW